MDNLLESSPNLAGVCRACLMPCDTGKCLLDQTHATVELVARLQSVACLQIIIDEKLPSYLCNICEEKTNEAYKFQETCRHSDEFVKTLLGIKSNKETEQPSNQQNFIQKEVENVKCENSHGVCLDENVNDNEEENNLSSDESEYIKEERHEASSSNFRISGHKLKQFAKENVDSVIETVRKKMQGVKGCRFCDHLAVNISTLCHHMAVTHKKQKPKWCWICNEHVGNLQEHNIIHLKDFECPFCQRTFTNNKALIHHLSRHATGRSIRCTPCDTTFARLDLLQKHNKELHPKKLNQMARHVKEMKLRRRLKLGSKQLSRMEIFPRDQVEAEIRKVEARTTETAKCPVCFFKAVNMKALTTHMLHIHKDQKDHWCFFCNRANVANLEEHKQQVHSGGNTCPFCGYHSVKVTKYVEHLLRHSDSRQFKCPYCEKCFINNKYLEKHKRLHDEINYLVEGKSSQGVAKRLPSSNTQETSSVVPVEVKLEIAGESNSSNAANQIDAGVDYNNKFCNICQKNVASMVVHMKRCHKQSRTPHVCPHCGKLFGAKTNLTSHLKLHSDVKPYQCQVCSKAFHVRTYLRMHMLSHTKERPFICQICGKGFSRSGVLTTHMRIHTGKPEQCEICDKRFCRTSELKVHMRSHTGETPYVCDQCGKGFAHSSNMFNHRRSHFTVGAYQCSYCDKAFSKKETRKVHEYKHTGVKPYKCSECPFAAAKSNELTKHMMSHENDQPNMDKPYSCEICTKRFQTKAHLYSHFERYHQSPQYQQLQ